MQNLEQEQDDRGKIDLTKIIIKTGKGMRHQWWILVVCMLAGASLFGIREVHSYSPIYEASSTFIVRSDAGQASGSYTDRLAASQMERIFPYILQSGELYQIVASDLGYASVPGSIMINTLSGTPVFTVRVRSGRPENAYNILQSVLKNYPKAAEYIIGNTTLIPMDETGIPQEPVNQMNLMGQAKKGAVLGFLGGFCIIVLFALSRKTVDSKSDLKAVLNISCLSSIPVVTFKKRKTKEAPLILITNKKSGQGFQEAIRTIGIRMAHYTKREREKSGAEKKVILVTSTLPGEGKSTVSSNLALSLAYRGNQVLLIDCDLRNPSVSATMGIVRKEKGLVDLIKGSASASELIQKIPDTTLSVITGGKSTGRASELLGSPKMKEMIGQLRDQYDYILLDCAPIGMLSDAMMLTELADTGLFVVKQDYAPIKQIVESVEILTSRGLELAGYVLNGVENMTGRYGGYYYSQYGSYRSHYYNSYYKK